MSAAPQLPGDAEILGDRIKQLLNNPDDQDAWGQELERLRGNGRKIAELSKSQPSALVRLADANNRMLTGSALRHLKRYDEALGELAQAEALLKASVGDNACLTSPHDPPCSEILDQLAATYSFVAFVRQARNEREETAKALERAAEVSAGTDAHGRHVAALVRWMIEQGRITQAAPSLLELIKAATQKDDPEVRKSLAEFAESFYWQVFVGISWLPGAEVRLVRDADPRDFFDMHGIGIGRPVKYGMTDWDEDLPTFVTVFFTQEMLRVDPAGSELFGYPSREEMVRNFDTDAYVREQMGQANFEPAAKYAYVRYVHTRFGEMGNGPVACRPVETGWVSFDEIRDRLEAAPALAVAPSTVQSIEVLEGAYSYLESQCQAKVP